MLVWVTLTVLAVLLVCSLVMHRWAGDENQELRRRVEKLEGKVSPPFELRDYSTEGIKLAWRAKPATIGHIEDIEAKLNGLASHLGFTWAFQKTTPAQWVVAPRKQQDTGGTGGSKEK